MTDTVLYIAAAAFSVLSAFGIEKLVNHFCGEGCHTVKKVFNSRGQI